MRQMWASFHKQMFEDAMTIDFPQAENRQASEQSGRTNIWAAFR
jgi:hypothetical protein